MSQIDEKHKELPWLGEPIHEERDTPFRNGGRYRTYRRTDKANEYSSIHWTEKTGAHETHGAIRTNGKSLDLKSTTLAFV
ncbi:MAG: hypothetical protein F6K10_21800 [Moorea sp. SIO2B7]|nr:hypothetical protein [Moorena sp. SIO2B7]